MNFFVSGYCFMGMIGLGLKGAFIGESMDYIASAIYGLVSVYAYYRK